MVLIEGVGIDGSEIAVVLRRRANPGSGWQSADAAFDEVRVRQAHLLLFRLQRLALRVAFVGQIRIEFVFWPDFESTIALLAGILGVGFGGVEGGKAGKGKEESFDRERVVGEKDGCADIIWPSLAKRDAR